jgi:hypothetical protein
MNMNDKVKKVIGIEKKPYRFTPAECEYYIICECQYGTQQCSMKRGGCVQCERRNSYITENVGADIETGRVEMYTEEGRKELWNYKK